MILSLILPSYNVAPYIEECLESALNQTLTQMEILCVDGDSTDGTREILEAYETRCQRGEWPGKCMKVIPSRIRSYGYQVNLALREATGTYIAILETDDYVCLNMYEHLTGLAQALQLDYIRAQHEYFVTKEDGSREFKMVHHYAPVNTLLTNTRLERIMTYDQNLWKGIYLRTFLEEYDIRFQETPGAAFQDIGFNMQVFSYARRAYYIEDSFYRYRADRDASSIHSLQFFQFYAQELTFLQKLDPACKKLYWPGIYERFACALCGEWHKAVNILKVPMHAPELEPHLQVLMEAFRVAMDDGLWPAKSTPKGQTKAVLRILSEWEATL